MQFRLITPPAFEPLTVETVKAHLRVDIDTEDALFDLYIAAAREKCEMSSRRALITQTLEAVVDAWPADGYLRLPRPPLQAITWVKYLDADGVEGAWTDYQVDARSEPGVVYFKSLPGAALFPSGAITVRYTAGYGDAPSEVPGGLRQAMLMLIGHWYENREAVNVGDIGNEMPMGTKDAFRAERVEWF